MRRILASVAVFFAFSSPVLAGDDLMIVWKNGTPQRVNTDSSAWTGVQKKQGWTEVWRQGETAVEDSRLPNRKLPVPVRESWRLPDGKVKWLAKKAVKAGRVTTPLGLASMAAQEAWELCQEGKWFCKPNAIEQFPFPETHEDGVYWEHRQGDGKSPSPERACVVSVEKSGDIMLVITGMQIAANGLTATCNYKYKASGQTWTSLMTLQKRSSPGCIDGYVFGNGVCNLIKSPGTSTPITEAQLDAALDAHLASNGINPDFYSEIQPDITIDDMTDISAQGQASSAPVSQTSTTTRPDGSTSTTTENTTYNITYNNGKTSITQKTETSVDGQPGITTEKPLNPEPGLDYSDADLPEVPDFYEQKYPDGLSGVWRDRKAAFDQTPMLKWLSGFTDGIPQGGKCPEFRLPLGGVAKWLPGIGDADVSPPCWIWDFAKMLLLIGTVVSCRRIVFGG